MTQLFRTGLLLCALSMGAPALADDASAPAPAPAPVTPAPAAPAAPVAPAAPAAGNPKHPCEAIHAACRGAGYFKGGHKKKKGLWKDCIDPLLAGKSVSGVNVDAALVSACQAKKAARHH